MTKATLANPASRPRLCLHGAAHLAVTVASVPSTGGNEFVATVLLRFVRQDNLSVHGIQKTVRSARSVEWNSAPADVVLSPQRLTARGQRRCATSSILRSIDRLAKEAIPENSDRKATFVARRPGANPGLRTPWIGSDRPKPRSHSRRWSFAAGQRDVFAAGAGRMYYDSRRLGP